jgi:hypothetical protein
MTHDHGDGSWTLTIVPLGAAPSDGTAVVELRLSGTLPEWLAESGDGRGPEGRWVRMGDGRWAATLRLGGLDVHAVVERLDGHYVGRAAGRVRDQRP